MSYWVGYLEQLAEQCLSADAIMSYISNCSALLMYINVGSQKLLRVDIYVLLN